MGALNFSFTSDDVDKMVAQKEKFQRNPVNYAMRKARLIKDKEVAIGQGDDERAKQMETKLNELEERAEELDKKRTSTISSVSLINDRNRKANVSKAEKAIEIEIGRKKREGVESNPFKRKACLPRLPNITKKGEGAVAKAAPTEQKENMKKIPIFFFLKHGKCALHQQLNTMQSVWMYCHGDYWLSANLLFSASSLRYFFFLSNLCLVLIPSFCFPQPFFSSLYLELYRCLAFRCNDLISCVSLGRTSVMARHEMLFLWTRLPNRDRDLKIPM